MLFMCVLVIMSKAGHTPPSTYVVADTRTETAPDEIKLSGSVSEPAAAAGAGARSRATGDGAKARRVRDVVVDRGSNGCGPWVR